MDRQAGVFCGEATFPSMAGYDNYLLISDIHHSPLPLAVEANEVYDVVQVRSFGAVADMLQAQRLASLFNLVQ